MEYTNINNDFKFEMDSSGKIYVYQLINEHKNYYDLIENIQIITESEFRYQCKCRYYENILIK